LAAVVVTAVVVFALRPRRVVVEGPSMEPTLEERDRLVVLRRRRPAAGDIVVVADPRHRGRVLVKRVMAVAGDEIVVEGDNRARSTDSRDFGPVRRRDVVGRAVYRYFPPARAGGLRSPGPPAGIGAHRERGTLRP
jgi:nickel-type superoxide dismutase maturation protease